VLCTAVLIYYLVESQHIMNTDAMLMIKAVGVFMVLSLAFVIKEELVVQKADDDIQGEKPSFFSAKTACMNFIAFSLLSFLYIIALPYAGFIIATLVFPAIAMLFWGVGSVIKLIVAPILLTAGIYLLFKVFLMISLPVGFLGI
jgi:hypothetical protein